MSGPEWERVQQPRQTSCLVDFAAHDWTRKRSPSRAGYEHDETLVEHLPNREQLLQICRAHCKGKTSNKILFIVLREFKNILRDDLAIDDLKTGLRKVDDRLYDLMNSETLKAAEAYAKENLQESKVRGTTFPGTWELLFPSSKKLKMRLPGDSVPGFERAVIWELISRYAIADGSSKGGAKLPGSAQVKGGDFLCDPKPPS